MKGFFVTGTDTGIGKTYTACLLMKHMVSKGYNVCGLKPIASGCKKTPDGLRNEDALAIAECANAELPYSLINRYSFQPAIAPHIAAQQAGENISFELIRRDLIEASQKADYIFVEGAGGWRVPLGYDGDMSDLTTTLALPIILVVGIRLGCINHALLTLESMQYKGIAVAGWIANHCNAHTDVSNENVETLKHEMDSPLITEIGFHQESIIPKIDYWH